MQNEKPILFSTEMVRAILDGRKSQTRRVVTRSNTIGFSIQKKMLDFSVIYANNPLGVKVKEKLEDRIWRGYCKWEEGMELWVRETFRWFDALLESDQEGVYSGWQYKADYPEFEDQPRWKPSIHMPRDASRIQLLVTSVRAELLQEISMEDIRKEGLAPMMGVSSPDGQHVWKNYQGNDHFIHDFGNGMFRSFVSLWDSINADRGFPWKYNPLVWVVEFEVKEVKG